MTDAKIIPHEPDCLGNVSAWTVIRSGQEPRVFAGNIYNDGSIERAKYAADAYAVGIQIDGLRSNAEYKPYTTEEHEV